MWVSLRPEIKIIFKYKDCLKVLGIVIGKYKDLVVALVLSFKKHCLAWKLKLKLCFNIKYCFYEEPKPKKQKKKKKQTMRIAFDIIVYFRL